MQYLYTHNLKHYQQQSTILYIIDFGLAGVPADKDNRDRQ